MGNTEVISRSGLTTEEFLIQVLVTNYEKVKLRAEEDSEIGVHYREVFEAEFPDNPA